MFWCDLIVQILQTVPGDPAEMQSDFESAMMDNNFFESSRTHLD